jgi:hypothetical protein
MPNTSSTTELTAQSGCELVVAKLENAILGMSRVIHSSNLV